MSSVYEDGRYLAENPSWHVEDSPWKAAQVAKMIARNKLKPKTVCEVGCGAGEILGRLQTMLDKDVVFTGYEISPHAFALCQAKGNNNLRFVLKDLLSEHGVTFDIVMVIDVIEHVEDCFGFLRQVKEKGTYKVFHIPLDLSAQVVFRGAPLMKLRASVGHIHSFTKDTALAILRDTGYDIVDYFYTSGSLELPGRGWRNELLKLPRKLCFTVNQDLTVRAFGGFSLLVLAK